MTTEPMGRPSKLTADVQEKLLAVIKLGAYRAAACDFAGITPETLRNWLRRGEAEGEGPCFELATQLKQAEASACIKAASDSDAFCKIASFCCANITI